MTGGCLVGVDGGGTKTAVQIADVDGVVLGRSACGGSNWEIIGVDDAVAVIGRAVGDALEAAGRTVTDVVAASYGLAGVDWPDDAERLDAGLAGLGLAGERVVVNDAFIALRAGCRRGWGIVSNVGTGTVTAGRRRDGGTARTMAVGWGEPSGSSGMVRDALHAIAAAEHGTAPGTALAAAFVRAAGVPDVPALFRGVSRRHLRPDPRWAPLIDDAAASGDGVARRLLRDAGAAHGAMVVGIARRLQLDTAPVDVAMCGGVHLHGSAWFADAFRDAVVDGCPAARLTVMRDEPVAGAIGLAMDLVEGARR